MDVASLFSILGPVNKVCNQSQIVNVQCGWDIFPVNLGIKAK